ncbi:MAG: UDP-2,3-diacylglucosamine diphosphatase LpxI [Verrucomicrobia bacterium]|nr:UDP-2,3-diacylglucosamine diphosphatase LpxI [Verrucomicrobiota bacterium]MCG2679305.1 UDP-2,3-diacylglucosamine diphosphatase LpxI [Kiritimatiellia bacterium]MBU4247318.1 UDP-2,3-diacylglucosamine diphosphatase LpxI [Verrucomicrobiota bacterium]MBU4292258.1 UDP-2,3-diacylglucosamine diphosphatase LpxI [Verrucomicrobiota bacterium]MBU4428278.1 UDP-2,3-diacylglucosamine diphosphatase LpxI [Verrucomicrobiota bacterium]
MNQPAKLGLIAGRGIYPLLLAESAKKLGVRRLVAVAFRGETDRAIDRLADEVHWLNVGQLTALLETFQTSGVTQAVMAGQITPTRLFHVRPDRRALALLARLRTRNAETIFGAIGDELKSVGVELLPASRFMESAMPTPGLLSRRAPTAEEQQDIELGCRVAKATSGLDIGQTAVVKQGTILAVEAFEGTDETLLRAGRLGGAGVVVVKVAKRGHDLRFDIPVIGLQTLKVLKKIRAAVLAVEAGKTILLECARLITEADKQNLAFLAVDMEK